MQLWDLESKGSKGGQGKVWAKDSDPKDPRAVPGDDGGQGEVQGTLGLLQPDGAG